MFLYHSCFYWASTIIRTELTTTYVRTKISIYIHSSILNCGRRESISLYSSWNLAKQCNTSGPRTGTSALHLAFNRSDVKWFIHENQPISGCEWRTKIPGISEGNPSAVHAEKGACLEPISILQRNKCMKLCRAHLLLSNSAASKTHQQGSDHFQRNLYVHNATFPMRIHFSACNYLFRCEFFPCIQV